jgi:hypothetical protein
MEHHHEMASSAFPLIDDLDFGVPPRTPMHSQMGSGIPMQPVRFYDLMPVWSTIHAWKNFMDAAIPAAVIRGTEIDD